MADSYFTLQSSSEGLYKDKGSKFLSFAIPIKSTDDVKQILEDYRRRFFDARHVCYAYMVGADRDVFRSNDDGEPSGTAGKPILGQINSFNLTDILIIVVRYFGGILLGTSGLITAYRSAAKDAIENAQIVERAVLRRYKISMPYTIVNDIMRIIKDSKTTICHTEYENDLQILDLEVQQAQANAFEQKINKYIGYGLKRL